MAKNLVIVESPAKAKTIEKYLGADYQVLASMGHIRDLPASKLGVDLENNFLPSYIIPIKAKKTLTGLKNALKDKIKVLLATDLDREGEAIAWHIYQALELDSKNIEVERITFDEITKQAIQEAVAHPREINQPLVDAQQARRVLDRLVGYTLSPVLWKKIYKGLSAGRVQSVALRLIVDREKERTSFIAVEYWSLKAALTENKSQKSINANLIEYSKQKIEQLTLQNKSQVDQIVESLKDEAYLVQSVEKKKVKRRPQAPYTTSTFQQDAVNKLSISSKRAMQIAQKLYEAGLITYMRTDSVSLSSQAVEQIRAEIVSKYGNSYLPTKPNFFQNKSKNAQEAHEAIRPANISVSQVNDEPIAQKVYDLIRKRTMASQMSEAEVEQTGINIKAGEAIFRANGSVIVFPGFLAVIGFDEKEDAILPEMKQGDQLKLDELISEQHFTEPPPRYSEATLIKTLEEKGIGRPSTYAPTIDTLIQRRYVQVEQRRFFPEEVGFLVTDLLVQHFPEIVDLGFTAGMEEQLDLIAEGKANYEKILADFWHPFIKQVEENTQKIEKVNTDETTDELCPNCNSPMVIKMGRFGKFLACSNFPECKTAKPLKSVDPTGMVCPICGKDLNEKRARRSTFFGCSGYPDCKFALWKKEHLPSKIEELEKEGMALEFKAKSLECFEVLGLTPIVPKPFVAKAKTSKTTKTSKTSKTTKAKPAKKLTKAKAVKS